MPVNITSARQTAGRDGKTLENAPDFGYKYPGSIDLHPRSEDHKRLLAAIMERVQSSHEVMSARYDVWNQLDKTLTSFIPLDEEEKREQEKDNRKPFSIVVPTSYAALETLLTYLVQTFFEAPIFRYDGVGGEDVLGAMLLEQVVHRQVMRGQMGVALHTMLRNSLVYGFGPVTPIWTVTEGYRVRTTPTDIFSRVAGFFQRGEVERKREKTVIFEGNELHSINPYQYFPDTSVAAWDVQSMEYVGWLRADNRMAILSEEETSDGEVFNAKYLDYMGGLSVYGGDESERDANKLRDITRHSGTKNSVDRIYLYWDLVPSEWNLGDSQYPEKWLFSVAGDQLILEAHPVRLDHQMFPVVTCAPDTDGFSPTPVSKMETIHGLQQFTNFLYNSHIANIRKAVHDMFVVDPEMINVNDILNPGPGRLIRTRRKAWGQGVGDGIEQLQVSDLTARHTEESLLVDRIIERATGATDPLQGTFVGGERKTAEETRTVTSAAFSRLERQAIMAGIQSFQPLGYMLASQTQQFMSREQYIQLIGRNEADLRAIFRDERRARVSPRDISVDYDVEVSDGTVSRSASPELWSQLYQMILQNPEAAQGIDTVRVFKYIAKAAWS